MHSCILRRPAKFAIIHLIMWDEMRDTLWRRQQDHIAKKNLLPFQFVQSKTLGDTPTEMGFT